MNWLNPAWVGRVVIAELAVIGMAARLLLRLLALIPAALRRFSLVVEQIFFVGNRSLSIVTARLKPWACWWHCLWCVSSGLWCRRCCLPGAREPR